MQDRGGNIFALKRELDRILSGKKRGGLDQDEAEDFARRFSDLAEIGLPLLARYLKKVEDPDVFERLTHLIELLNDHSYASVLNDIFLDGNYKDSHQKVKIELFATLKSYDSTYPCHAFGNFFDSPEDAYMAWIKRVLEDFDKREYRVISLLEELLDGGAANIKLIRKIAVRFGGDSVPLLSLLANCDDGEVASAAISALGKIKDDRSVAILKEILRYSWSEGSVKDAGKALRRLAFSGYDISRVEADAIIENLDCCKAFLGPVDLLGNFNLCFAAKRGGDIFETICLVINDENGILDVYGAKRMREEDLLRMVEEVRKEEAFLETDLDHFLAVLNGALYMNEQSDAYLPPEFHYRKRLLSGRLRSVRYFPKFDDHDLKAIKRDAALIAKSETLLDRKEFRQWPLHTSGAFFYAEKLSMMSRGQNRLSSFRELRIIEEFIRDEIIPMKGKIARSLFQMADFLDRKRCAEETRKMVLATALNIGNGKAEQLLKNPFLRKLALESLRQCTKVMMDSVDLEEPEYHFDE